MVIEPTYGTLINPSTVRMAQLGCSRRKTSAQYKASKRRQTKLDSVPYSQVTKERPGATRAASERPERLLFECRYAG